MYNVLNINYSADFVVDDIVNEHLLQYHNNLRKKNNGLMVTKIRGKYFLLKANYLTKLCKSVDNMNFVLCIR